MASCIIKLMIKYIFSDLDATLLSDDKTISKRNIEAIKSLKDKGCEFLFATGRLPFTFEELKKETGITSYSSCNGAILVLDGKIIKDEYLDKEMAKYLIDYGVKHKLNERIFVRDQLFIVNFDDSAQMPLRYPGAKDISIEDAYKILNEQKIYKIAYHTADREKLVAAQADILASDLKLEAVFSNPIFLEFGKFGENKGKGVKNFMEITGAKASQIICLGDNENDFSMMQGDVGISVCPANAIDLIKSVASEVMSYNNNEDFVARVIEKYV